MIEQLLCHLWGDYILQSDWMATNKTKKSLAALAHVATYILPFLFLIHGHVHPYIALLVIAGTHFFIDRFRLARYLVWAKNWMAPWGANLHWNNCKTTGYLDVDRLGPPAWLSVWLLIIADNTLHITINYLTLRFL